jgi:hypothetical protein
MGRQWFEIVSLPGDPDTVRGFGAPRMIVGRGRLYRRRCKLRLINGAINHAGWLIIEPGWQAGHFCENWRSTERWSASRSPVGNANRSPASSIRQQRLGPMFCGMKVNSLAGVEHIFSEMIERALVDD